VPQNLYEFWAVATRPIAATNGLGLTAPQAKAEMLRILSLFAMLPDTPAIFAAWGRLVDLYDIKGKTTHDARIAAAMITHNVAHILTFNDRDFARYSGISVIHPTALAAHQTP
jgi:predicted nucleic acid-binding protein